MGGGSGAGDGGPDGRGCLLAGDEHQAAAEGWQQGPVVTLPAFVYGVEVVFWFDAGAAELGKLAEPAAVVVVVSFLT
ncbi:MAG: hypothetical protein NVS3B26_11760 [Mycobacteriales bacterium]